LAGDGKLPWLTRFLENGGKWSGGLPQSPVLEASLMETLWRGSLPDETAMSVRFVKRYAASYVQTYLERDVRIAGNISDIEAFSRFLALAAALSGQEINHSQFGREIGISPATAGKWLGILKATFQWHEVPPWQGMAPSFTPAGKFTAWMIAPWPFPGIRCKDEPPPLMERKVRPHEMTGGRRRERGGGRP
jgi:hypothetical protein